MVSAVAGKAAKLPAESYAIASGGEGSGAWIAVCGSDERGLIFGIGEGIRAVCRASAGQAKTEPQAATPPAKADLSSLSSLLQARWKGNAPAASSKAEPLQVGQIRNFKIVKLDPEKKAIEVELA